MPDRPAQLARWADADRQRAVLPADRAMTGELSALRTLVLDLAGNPAAEEELYDACAMLGRQLAQRGASPTLASATMDGAAAALLTPGAAWLAPARAAVVEGFARTLREMAHHEALQAWEFPSCAVALGEAGVAIAAGYPSEDDEELAAWAARVAKAAALAGVRRAVVSGSERACDAALDAFGVVGIEAQRTPAPRRR